MSSTEVETEKRIKIIKASRILRLSMLPVLFVQLYNFSMFMVSMIFGLLIIILQSSAYFKYQKWISYDVFKSVLDKTCNVSYNIVELEISFRECSYISPKLKLLYYLKHLYEKLLGIFLKDPTVFKYHPFFITLIFIGISVSITILFLLIYKVLYKKYGIHPMIGSVYSVQNMIERIVKTDLASGTDVWGSKKTSKS